MRGNGSSLVPLLFLMEAAMLVSLKKNGGALVTVIQHRTRKWFNLMTLLFLIGEEVTAPLDRNGNNY